MWSRWCSGCRVLCQAGLRRGRRPAREIATREPAAPTDLRPPRGLPARFGRPRRELRSARRLVVRPGPAGPAAASNRAVLVVSVLSVSLRHRPRAPQPGPPVPPAPSTPVGPGVLMRIHIIAEPTPNSACNSPTTASSFEFRSLELQRFQTSLKLHPIELHAIFLRQSQPPPTGAAARPPHPRLGPTGGIKLALRGSISTQAVQNSPSTHKTPQKRPFFASMANFVSVPPKIHSCLASFISPKSSVPKHQQRCHGFHAPIVKPSHRRHRFHQTSNQGFWFSARYSDTHACYLRHNPGSVGA